MTITMPAYSLAGVETRYLGPTNHRGSRIKARRSEHTSGDPTVTVDYDHSLSPFENHAEAARRLVEQYGWDGDYHAAATKRGYIFARAVR